MIVYQPLRKSETNWYDWFEEIHVDLDTVQDSATIQNSNSADTSSVFNYDPGPIDT